MASVRYFYKLSAFLIIFLFCISACSTNPSFDNNKTITITVGKSSTATVNVKNWSNDSQITLLPGGPYLEDNFYTQIPVNFIGINNKAVFAVNEDNEICSLDFSVIPAKRISCLKLANKVTALLVQDQIAYIGFKNAGILCLNIEDPANMRQIADINNAPLITRIRMIKQKLYALSAHNNINIYSIAIKDHDNRHFQLDTSVHLPVPVNDFSVHDNQLVVIGDNIGIGVCTIQSSPVFLNKLSLQDTPLQLTLVDNLAYIADATGGMVLFHVDQDGQLIWVGSYAKIPRIVQTLANKDFAYVIDRQLRIVSLNMKNKALPITGSFYMPNERINQAIMDNSAVYLATNKGIDKVRFPPQTHAQISNEGIDLGGSRRAYIEDNTAYVADWFSGLHIYDISNPSHPTHISNFHTPGSSKGVAVSDGYAYVGDDDHGLQIIDVHDRRNPVKISDLPTDGLAYTLKKIGNRVYLADHRGGFYIIDVSNVKKPEILSHFDTPGKSWAIDVAGNIAYVADDTTGLLVFNVANPHNPKLMGKFDPGGYAEDVEVVDRKAYVSFFDKGFYILDVSNPSSPMELSHTVIPGNCRSVMIKDNLAYLAGWESGLNIVDISNATSPIIVGRYDTRGSAWGANIYRQHAYVWDWWGGVKVVNVSNPNSPTLAGQYQARGSIYALRQHDHYLYTANGSGGVQVYDIQNVLNPIWTTGADINGDVHDIWINPSSGYLYAASGAGGLVVLDIRNPFYIRQATAFNTEGNAVLVRQTSDYLFVANDNSRFIIFDISDPLHPKATQRLNISVRDMWVQDKTILMVNDKHELLAYQLSASGQLNSTPLLLSKSVGHVVADKRFMAASMTDKGIKIWKSVNGKYSQAAKLEFPQSTSDMRIDGDILLAYSQQQGLMSFDISNMARPKLKTQFPATDLNTKFIEYNNAVFFAGAKTISSVLLLPSITAKQKNKSEVELTVPPRLPVGNYHLAISNDSGITHIWPNAIRVSRVERNKPKITPQEFKKLLEQYKSQHPVPAK